MTVDVHAHHIPEAFVQMLERDGDRWGVEARPDGGVWRLAIGGRARKAPLLGELLDLDRCVAGMDETGLDIRVLSPWAGLIDYGMSAAIAGDYARRFNEQLAEATARAPDRLRALAMVPLQAPRQAAEELEHAVTVLGMVGAEILTRVGSDELDTPDLDPFWRRAEDLGCVVLLHPTDSLAGRGLERYRIDNLVGNPAETTIAVTHMVLGGVFERFPGLRLCAAHAGGYLPLAAGRLDHGHHVRRDVIGPQITRPPSAWLREIYYDTIAHSSASLRFLGDFAGARRMLLGSDAPFVMGEPDPVDAVRSIPGFSDKERDAVLSGNAKELNISC